MSAQDKTEQVLRALHIMLAQSKVYDAEQGLVIVNKREMIQLFSSLNQCIYEIMDEHELTKNGRDEAERQARKKGEEIITDASKKAEDPPTDAAFCETTTSSVVFKIFLSIASIAS